MSRTYNGTAPTEVFVFPTSFAQQRLWFLNQLVPDNPFYNVDTMLRLQTPLDHAVLEAALNEIVRRHEVLRTVFHEVDGEPVQVISPDLSLKLGFVDLAARSPAERERMAIEIAREEARRPFDLGAGPLIRAALIRLRDDDQIFLLTMHHIVSDGWSMQVLFRELNALYEAFGQGLPSPLPELPVQYADFAVWQREQLQGDILDAQLAYWRKHLAGMPVLRLATDRIRPPIQSFEGSTIPFEISRDLYIGLKALSQREGVTLFMTMLAAFQVLLHRYTSQDEIVVGVPIANRNRREIEALIGFFVNSLVFRTDVSGSPTFRELLVRVREIALGAYAHQDLPFEKLVEELAPQRDMSRNPLFQVSFQLFTHQSEAESASNSEAETSELFKVEKGTASIDLAFDLGETAQGVSGRVEYSSDLFDESTVERFATQYRHVLEQIVSSPNSRIGDFKLVVTAEEQRILVESNDTRLDFEPTCIHDLVTRQVERTPSAVALVAGREQSTYAELNRRSNRIAHHLRSLQAGPGSFVGVCMERCTDLVASILGVLKSGAAYVPLDPTYPESRLEFLIRDSGVIVVLTQQKWAERLGKHAPRVACIDTDPEFDAQTGLDCPGPAASLEDPAYLIYTSGTTGVPKGVMVPHRAASNYLQWMQKAFPLQPADRALQKYSISFDVSVWEIFAPLLVGARLILAEPGRHIDSGYMLDLIQEHRVTIVDLVPSMLESWLEEPDFNRCRSLKRVICGGEAMPKQLQDRFFEHLDAELLNFYGPTETTISSTYWRCLPDEPSDSVPIGRPIANTTAYILDQYGHLVPPGVAGELHIGGAGLALGYWNDAELTRARFVPNPFAPGSRLYRTGDLTRYRPDGNIEYLGRLDHQVKVRGFRIELGEIESRLRQHPWVKDAVAIAVEHGPSPYAYSGMEADDLVQQLKRRGEAEAARILSELESLTPVELEFLLQYETDPGEKKNTMLRNGPEFELFLRLKDSQFIKPPQEGQRNWTLQRALDEFSEDLQHLDRVSKRFVPGSKRATIAKDWTSSKAQYDGSQLIIEGQQVMQDWERPLMKAMAGAVTESHGDVLEVGFGMGISAAFIQDAGVRSHTIIECNHEVALEFERWKRQYPGRDIRLVHGKWKDVHHAIGPFDAIFFDTYPLEEEEFVQTVINSITFAESFIPVASKLLRQGGVFSYYTNEIDSFSRRHQRLVLDHFSSISLSVVKDLAPPEDCNYWWADSMMVVKALK